MKAARVRRERAFTLVEVILAVIIISAIMTVLLFFYQRSVEARQAVLEKADFVSESRMLMEQITGELRTARVVEDQFIGLEGGSNFISIICTSIPWSPRWILSSNEMVALPPITDLRRVTYRLLSGTNTLDVRGVDRTEEMLTASAFTAGTNSTEFVNAAGTNVISEAETNLGTLEMTNETQVIRRPLSERIKYMQFRFWGGTNWVESWSSLELPSGVEISFGHEPLDPQAASAGATAAEEYSYEIFRRVVYLPNSVPHANKIVPEENTEPFF